MKFQSGKLIGTAILGLYLVFMALGVSTSVSNGVGWDEPFEQTTTAFNIKAIRGLMQGDLDGYRELQGYQDKYYGIVFHFASLPFQVMLAPVFHSFLGLEKQAAFLLPKHLLVFALFGVSAVFFYRLSRLFVDDRQTCHLLTLIYCLCPYFLGHGTMNVKDAPFLAIWMICTYKALVLAKEIALRERAGWKPFVDLGLITGLLLAIRLAGVLIVVFYGCLLVTVVIERRSEARRLLLDYWRQLVIASVVSLIVTWIAYPILWLEPWRILQALSYMAAHPWQTCTLTAGECVPSQNTPIDYIPIWFVVKMPLIVLLGLALLPVSIVRTSRGEFRQPQILALAIGHIAIVAVLIVFHSNLYSEIRQILFVMPIMLLVGLVSLYQISRAGLGILAVLTLALFLTDNAKLFPYQYAWYNEIARLGTIDGRFETDYWALSAREAASIVESIQTQSRSTECVLARPAHLYRLYLTEDNFPCVVDLLDKDKSPPRPNIVAATSRFGFTDFPGCTLVGAVTRELALTNTKMTMARVLECP